MCVCVCPYIGFLFFLDLNEFDRAGNATGSLDTAAGSNIAKMMTVRACRSQCIKPFAFASAAWHTFEDRVRKRLAFLSACCASASGVSAGGPSCSTFLHASAYVSIFLHTSAYVRAFLRLTAVCEITACVEYCAGPWLSFLLLVLCCIPAAAAEGFAQAGALSWRRRGGARCRNLCMRPSATSV